MKSNVEPRLRYIEEPGTHPSLGSALKRPIDYCAAFLALLLLAPLFVLIAVLIKLDSPGPVFFKQERVGWGGRIFNLYKFRSMRVGAEAEQEALQAHNSMSGPLFKVKDDPRITCTGRWLRRTSLDELPQLLNVLLGDMSLVGPRPPLPSEVMHFEPWHHEKFVVRPGITGLWQVSGRNTLTSFDQMITLDLTYIRTWSPWLDLMILARTLPAVVRGTGAS
jgi:exopolysaccharide biosynthesis polyprenyl glycosylphosphotransferase